MVHFEVGQVTRSQRVVWLARPPGEVFDTVGCHISFNTGVDNSMIEKSCCY